MANAFNDWEEIVAISSIVKYVRPLNDVINLEKNGPAIRECVPPAGIEIPQPSTQCHCEGLPAAKWPSIRMYCSWSLSGCCRPPHTSTVGAGPLS